MPIYWVGAQLAGEAAPMAQQTVAEICAGLAAASWIIGAGIAYWFGPDEPKAVVDVSLNFDPDPSWACVWHPESDCYGTSMGCNASTT
jgi:hypothetical protein